MSIGRSLRPSDWHSKVLSLLRDSSKSAASAGFLSNFERYSIDHELHCLSLQSAGNNVVYAPGQHHQQLDRRTLNIGIKQLERIRVDLMNLVSRFWRELLVSDVVAGQTAEKNASLRALLTVSVAAMYRLDMLGRSIVSQLDRQFDTDPAFLRAGARYEADAHGNIFKARELLIRAEILEDDNSKLAAREAEQQQQQMQPRGRTRPEPAAGERRLRRCTDRRGATARGPPS